MVTVTQDDPGASISTLVDAVFSGVWQREEDDREDNLVELVEIELFRHETSHSGEVALWTFTGVVTQADSYADSYTVPLPGSDVIDLAGDYCWRVRLRDNFGSWTAWSSKDVFAYASTAPVLSEPTIPANFPEYETLRHLFFGAAYSDADGDRPHRLYVRLYKASSEEVVTQDDTPYMGTPSARLESPNDDNYQANVSGTFLVKWDNDGDHPRLGNPLRPLTGPFSYVGSVADRTGLQVDAHGTVRTVTTIGSIGGSGGGTVTLTVMLKKNGAMIGQQVQTTTGGLRVIQLVNWTITVTDVAVVEDDVFEVTVDRDPPTGDPFVVPQGAGNLAHTLSLAANPGDLTTGIELTETVWSFDTDILLWATQGQYEGLADASRVGTWYNGRGLGPGTYYWTMTATDKRGVESNELSGYLVVTKGWEPDPGASPNLTGFGTP